MRRNRVRGMYCPTIAKKKKKRLKKKEKKIRSLK